MRGERETHNDTAAMNIQTDADARVESAENFAAMRLKIPNDVSHISPSAPVFPVMRMTMARASEPKGAMLNHAESSKDVSPPSDRATLLRMGGAQAWLKTKGGRLEIIF